jgi:hypothetical protein
MLSISPHWVNRSVPGGTKFAPLSKVINFYRGVVGGVKNHSPGTRVRASRDSSL